MPDFGTKIPDLKDIVEIKGTDLVDKDGTEVDRQLVLINHDLGGGWEIAHIEDEK